MTFQKYTPEQIKSRAIILKTQVYGESDLLLTTLNPNGGRINLIAKGALKSKKRFGGGILEPIRFIGIEYRTSSRSSLHFLQNAWLISRFEGIRKDYDKIQMAFYFLGLVQKISQEGDQNSSGMFNLLGNSLNALSVCQNLETLSLLFKIRLLLEQGILPKSIYRESILLNTSILEHHILDQHPALVKKYESLIQTNMEKYLNGLDLPCF